MPPSDDFRYAAFLSYSSSDSVFARRLHRALERYRIPSSLGQFQFTESGPKNRVYPVFLDREELPSGELREELKDALRKSSALVVVCSPAAAKSAWVNREIETFLELGRRERIFGVVAPDAPLTAKNGSDAIELSFPPAFRGAAHHAEFTPIVGDARPGKDGVRRAWLKVVAGIADSNLGALQDRDAARRVRRAAGISATVFAIILVFVALAAGYAIQNVTAWASRSQRAVQLAEEALDDRRAEDALLLALAGLPSGRGHWLVPPNRQVEIVLERVMNELIVTKAAEVKAPGGMMAADRDARQLGALRGDLGWPGSTEFEMTGVNGLLGVSFIDARSKTTTCQMYADLPIYHAGFIDATHAIISLFQYRPYFAVIDIARCREQGPPFALIAPAVDAPRSDTELVHGSDQADPALAFRILPLQWFDSSQPLDGNALDRVVPLASYDHERLNETPTIEPGVRALQAESQEGARAARGARSVSSLGGWADGVVLIALTNPRELALFDVRAREVVSRTTYPQVNSHMGGDSDDDHVIDSGSKLLINLDAKIGMVVKRGFQFFQLGTATGLVGASVGCGGACLNAAGWSFDLERAIAIGVGTSGDAIAWERDRQASLARSMPSGDSGLTEIPEEITKNPVLSRAQKVLEHWYDQVGHGLITHDLDGELPSYMVATSGDGSKIATTTNGNVWLVDGGTSNIRRLPTTFAAISASSLEYADDKGLLLAMDPGGTWLAALGPHDSWVDRLVVFDLPSGRRLFDRPVARSATLDAIAGRRGVWLSDARQILLAHQLDSRSLFTYGCSRRPEGRTVLTTQMLDDLGLKAQDSDPCRSRFVLRHLIEEFF